MNDREMIEVATGDGVRIALEHIPPRLATGGKPRGAVWMGHAMLANRRSLDRPAGAGLASEIAAAGMHAYTADLRGHGAARGSNGALQWKYREIIEHDFPAVQAEVQRRHPDLRIGALGHSLAAHAAVAWSGIETLKHGVPPIDALVTIGANVWIRQIEPSRMRWLRKLAVLAALSAIGRTLGKLPGRGLRLGSDDAPYTFVRDWISWARHDKWGGLEHDYFAGAAQLTIPVLAIFGAGDSIICHPDSGRMFHERLERAAVEMHVAGRSECGHVPDHMSMVTDKRSRPLWQRIARWLAGKLDPSA